MAKRFTDTEIWDKAWFMELDPYLKCFVKYVRDKCDVAGIWNPNYTLATLLIGTKVNEDDLLNIDNGKQFEKLPDGKIYCVDFVEFQYGNSLSTTSPIHKKVLDLLDKYSIKYNTKVTEVKIKSFEIPTLEEVIKEMETKTTPKNARVQAERFLGYYNSNGWMVGRNKMKSWKGAISGWISRCKPEAEDTSDIKARIQSLGNKKLSELDT